MKANHQIEISVIYVNYYCTNDIIDSIKSVLNQIQEKDSLEFIITSNSPISEDALHNLNSLHDDLKILVQPNNLGFAKANNIGAQEAAGSFLLFLNPDTLFLNDVIQILKNFYQVNSSSGILGPATYDDNGQKYPSVKRDVSIYGMFKWLLGGSILGVGPYRLNKTDSVDVINGSAMFVSKNFYQQLGGMCEDFFMYWEEHDLCKRCREAGQKVWFVNNAMVQHKGGTSTSSRFIPMEVEKHKSQKKYLQNHHPNLVLLNRILGSVSYLWRTLLNLLLFNSTKIKQFSTLFIWYTFRYR